jgi:hypothetical protein
MHALSLALVLAAAPAPLGAAPASSARPVPVVAAGPTPAVRPTLVTDEAAPSAGPAIAPVPVTSTSTATPTPTSTATATSTSTTSPPRPPAAPVPHGLVEKLGQGDRAFLAGEYRNALFAYQDAVYLAPRSAVARVRLGRAYLALRYPGQATAQAEQALALDGENADARKLLDDAKAAPARPAVTATTPPRTAPAEMAPVLVFSASPAGRVPTVIDHV